MTPDFPTTARAALNAALDQLGSGPEITRGIIVAQLHAAQMQYLEGVGQQDFVKARREGSCARGEVGEVVREGGDGVV